MVDVMTSCVSRRAAWSRAVDVYYFLCRNNCMKKTRTSPLQTASQRAAPRKIKIAPHKRAAMMTSLRRLHARRVRESSWTAQELAVAAVNPPRV